MTNVALMLTTRPLSLSPKQNKAPEAVLQFLQRLQNLTHLPVVITVRDSFVDGSDVVGMLGSGRFGGRGRHCTQCRPKTYKLLSFLC